MEAALFDRRDISPEEQFAEFDRQNAACNEFLRKRAVREQREQSEMLIRKTYDPDQVERPRPQQPMMSEDVARAWHAWADEKIAAAIDLYDKAIVAAAHNELVGAVEAEFDATIKELEELRSELAALRADMNITSAIVRGDVKQLKAKAADVA
jgi:hypothetical protein